MIFFNFITKNSEQYIIPLVLKISKPLKTITMNLNKLTSDEVRILLNKGTETAFSGEHYLNFDDGIYLCKLCNTPLFLSTDKFHSCCGWPAFDDAIKESIKLVPEPDGESTEVVCACCGGHLGHVYYDERYTAKNIRYSINSIALIFQSTPLNISSATSYGQND
jgi:peptide methionine sulfoxide reductase msrA/msrB